MTSATRVVTSARKGGAGKTVVTAVLARELVRQGARVLVVDLDAQSVSVSRRLGADVKSPLAFTAIDLVLGQREFTPQTLPIGGGELDIVASNQRDVAGLERQLVRIHDQQRLTCGPNARRAVLDVRLSAVESAYDFVLVDTPTGLGEVTTHAMEAATLILSPIDMGCEDNVESVSDLLEHRAELARQAPVWFILNKWVRTRIQCRRSLARAKELCGDQLLASVALPQCEAVPLAMADKTDISGTSDTAVALQQNVAQLGQFVLGAAQPSVAAPSAERV